MLNADIPYMHEVLRFEAYLGMIHCMIDLDLGSNASRENIQE